MGKVFRKVWRKIKYYLIRIFRLKQGSRQIAIGFVLGFFPCWFPTFGIGPAMSVALAKIARVNVVASIVAAALGSFMWPLLFFFNYRIGGFFTKDLTQKNRELHDVKYDKEEYLQSVEEVNHFSDVGYAFTVGSVINCILFTIIGYFVIYYIFSRYRLTILNKLRAD